MAIYQYRVRDQQGKIIKGFMEASHESLVVDKLRLSGYYITSIQQKEIANQKGVFLYNRLKVTRRAFTHYLGVFSIILDLGLPLNSSLGILSEQIKHPILRRVTKYIKSEIEKGSTFAATLENYPDIFSEMFRAMVRTGEAKGELKEVIKELCLFYRQEGEIREKITTSIGFPLLIFCFSLILLIGLLSVVMPHFSNMVNSVNLNLSLFAKGSLAFGNFLHDYIIGICVTFLIFGGIYHLAILKGKGRYFRDKYSLKIPILGVVIRKLALARAYTTSAVLLKGGLSTEKAFAIAHTMATNQAIAEELSIVPEEIQKAENLLSSEEAALYLPADLRLMALGDRTMNLETVLRKLADLYMQEVYYLNHYYLRNGLFLLSCLVMALMIRIIFSVDLPLLDWAAAFLGS